MDAIFRKTPSIWSVVKVARDEPQRFGKHGELLINYEETEEHAIRRRSSVMSGVGAKGREARVENIEHANPDYRAENGFSEKE